ncbi:MAG: LamG domain-containing protein [Actinobacteria bacterium]|nr:LamG domain-containing protein [Actinomycetota bacterium]
MPGISKLSYTRQFPRYQFSPVASNAYISTSNKKFGTASLFMDGTSDDIRIYDTGTALRNGDFTIECWIWLPNVSSTHGICDFRTSGANQIAPAIYVNTSSQIILNMNGTNRITAGGVPTRTWWHFAYSRSGNSNKIFIDGTQAGSTYTDQSDYTFSQLIIGSLTGGNNNPADAFYDEFRISRISRYSSTFTPATEAFTNDEHTLLLLHFNDYNGSTNIVDDIGEPIVEGTRTALTATRNGNPVISTAQSKFGGSSGYFDGVGDSIQFNDITLYQFFRDFTIEMWIRPEVNTGGSLYDCRSTSSQGSILLRLINGTIDYYVSGSSRLSHQTTINVDTWYHVALTRSGTTTRLFVDGVVSSSTFSDSNNFNNSIANAIGAFTTGGSNNYKGYIDELRVSNIARYTDTFTVATQAFTPDTNTLLLLHMDGSNGSTTFTDSVS